MQGYFGGKRVLKVLLGTTSIYTYKEGGAVKPPYVFTTAEKGYLSTGSTSDSLLYNASTNTTSWLPVTGGKSYLLTFPNSNRCIIQWKYGTTITPAEAPFGTASADGKIVTAPANAQYLRIYFNSAGGSTGTMSIQEL